ncbi:MAG: hypothetical protein ACKV2O_13705 [Acidimicrobiales bacterium]
MGFLDIRYHRLGNVILARQLVRIDPLDQAQITEITAALGNAYLAAAARIRSG